MRFGRRTALALPALIAARTARAEPPITLVIGSPPGSAGDLWVRSFAAFLERHWPYSAIAVLNRAGEGGIAAARVVATTPRDPAAAPVAHPGNPGREAPLIGAVATPLLLARAIEKNETALLDHLRCVAAVAQEPLLLLGQPGRVGDLDALRALGPGALLATPPAGSAAHLAARALARAAGLDLLAFASAGAARQALLAGNVPCALLAAPDAMAAIRDDRLAALGVAQTTRTSLLPDLPTLREGGIPVALTARRGFVAGASTSPALIVKLAVALAATVADPELAAQATEAGYLPHYLGPIPWAESLRRTRAALLAGTLASAAVDADP